jgi:methanethiol S-methyltransferase
MAPSRRSEWRSMGVVIAFFVALFTEMYGFPLTIYALTALLGSRYHVLNPFSHGNGHLWLVLFGGGNVTMTIIHLVSNALVVVGFVIM